MGKELIIVGDRVLIDPDAADDKTDKGLYLPQGFKEKDKIQGGTVVKIGPGYPIPDPGSMEIEPWQTPRVDGKYFPLQAREGDYSDAPTFRRGVGVPTSEGASEPNRKEARALVRGVFTAFFCAVRQLKLNLSKRNMLLFRIPPFLFW